MAVKKQHSTPREKTLFVAHQLSFANSLAGNDKKSRDKALKKLTRYLAARGSGSFPFSDDDLMRIWKGLFYCMWMSDKPLVQEELCENISNLTRCFESTEVGLLFIKTFFSTMSQEWFGIDTHRMDKFQMFVRRFLRYSFRFCKDREWDLEVVKGLANVFRNTVLNTSDTSFKDKGFLIHLCDIYLEELAKVSGGKLQNEIVLELLKPFAEYLQTEHDSRLKSTVVKLIFLNLIRQSKEGIEYEEKFRAWLQAGCPGESCEDMQFVPDDDDADNEGEDESEQKVLDPRAGKVNVFIPSINFNPGTIAEMLKGCINSSLKPKNSRCLYYIANKFQKMAEGEYPLARKKFYSSEDVKKAGLHRDDYTVAINEAVQRMQGEKNKKRKLESNGGGDDDDDDDDSPKAEKKRKLQLQDDKLRKEDMNEKKSKKLMKEMKKKEKYMQRRKAKEEKRQRMIAENKTNKSIEENGHKDDADPEDNIENEPCCSQSSVEEFMNNFNVPERKSESSSSFTVPKGANNKIDSENMQTPSGKQKSKKSVKKESPMLKNDENIYRSESEVIGKVRRILRSSTQQAKTPSTPVQASWKVTDCMQQQDKPQCSGSGCASTSEGAGNENSLTETKSHTPLKQSPRLKRLSLIKSTPGSGKRVNIDLLQNKFQGVSEYEEQVRLSPSIPYDAKKNPDRGVLKPSPFRSPINPFYRPPKGVRIVFS